MMCWFSFLLLTLLYGQADNTKSLPTLPEMFWLTDISIDRSI